MGGFRCSYKNCSIRSDGKTHLFHYPVFERARCHQWLTNCKRFDFFDLKVFQLKNRVVCEHHFTDNSFMNSSKFKLKHDAIPTLDGPYVDTIKEPELTVEATYRQLCYSYYPVEDIENYDIMTPDIKAKALDKKYHEFLNIYPDFDVIRSNSPKPVSKPIQTSNTFNRNNIPIDSAQSVKYIDVTNTTCDYESTKIQTEVQSVDIYEKQENNLHKSSKTGALSPIKQEMVPRVKSKIRIIGEQKISKPFVVKTSNLRPILPSDLVKICGSQNNNNIMVKTESNQNNLELNTSGRITRSQNNNNLRVINESNVYNSELNTNVRITGSQNHNNIIVDESNLNNFELNTNVKDESLEKITEVVDLQPIAKDLPMEEYSVSTTDKPMNDIVFVNTSSNEFSNPRIPRLNSSRSKGKSLLKVNHKKLEKIKEKRKFNMKLRDIIQERLEHLDEQEVPQKLPPSNVAEENNTIPDSQDWLEQRFARMEESLLEKIDERFKRNSLPSEIQEVRAETKRKATKRSVASQTSITDLAYKKYLFNEISKYLNPSTNSLIYEELFIDQYAPDAHPFTSQERKKLKRW